MSRTERASGRPPPRGAQTGTTRPPTRRKRRKRPITEAYLALERRYKLARRRIRRIEGNTNVMRTLVEECDVDSFRSIMATQVRLMEEDMVRQQRGMRTLERTFARSKIDLRSYIDSCMMTYDAFQCFLLGFRPRRRQQQQQQADGVSEASVSSDGRSSAGASESTSALSTEPATTAGATVNVHSDDSRSVQALQPPKPAAAIPVFRQAIAVTLQPSNGTKSGHGNVLRDDSAQERAEQEQPRECPLTMLSQGLETTLAIQQCIAAYLGVPTRSSVSDLKGLSRRLSMTAEALDEDL